MLIRYVTGICVVMYGRELVGVHDPLADGWFRTAEAQADTGMARAMYVMRRMVLDTLLLHAADRTDCQHCHVYLEEDNETDSCPRCSAKQEQN